MLIILHSHNTFYVGWKPDQFVSCLESTGKRTPISPDPLVKVAFPQLWLPSSLLTPLLSLMLSEESLAQPPRAKSWVYTRLNCQFLTITGLFLRAPGWAWQPLAARWREELGASLPWTTAGRFAKACLAGLSGFYMQRYTVSVHIPFYSEMPQSRPNVALLKTGRSWFETWNGGSSPCTNNGWPSYLHIFDIFLYLNSFNFQVYGRLCCQIKSLCSQSHLPSLPLVAFTADSSASDSPYATVHCFQDSPEYRVR